MRRVLLLLSGAFAIATAGAVAQATQPQPVQRPDFSGHWILTTPGAGPDDPLGVEGTITQNNEGLTITAGNRWITYRFDGSGFTTNAQVGSGTRLTDLRWISGALMTTTRTDGGNGGRWEEATILALEGMGPNTQLSIVTIRALITGTGTHVLRYRRK